VTLVMSMPLQWVMYPVGYGQEELFCEYRWSCDYHIRDIRDLLATNI